MYTPPAEILKKYADVLIKFALWSGEGVDEDDVVILTVPECAKAFLPHLQRSIMEAKAHMILNYLPDGISRDFFENATEKQLTWVPEKYMLERVNTGTHFVAIIAEADKHELEGLDSKRIMIRQKAMKFYMDARRNKEDAGNLTWTLCLYGTPAMAKEVGMTEEEYWDEIIKACFLDEADPIAKWKEVFNDIGSIQERLNALPIEWLHVKGEDADLKVKVGTDRNWLGGSGRNIPSFELFISPDWRGTEGWIKFNEPLYRYGVMVKDVRLEFKEGKVVSSSASQNGQVIQDMIAVENADKIGEYSLTDGRFSRITKFMGETLFDENVGGKYGNTHLALGMAYRDSYIGNPKDVPEHQWKDMGFNDSAIHTDIVSTTNRIVTATLTDGSQKVIYENGKFTV